MASKNATQEGATMPPVTMDQEESEDSKQETRMGELDKVRNILFGEQIRVYEERMERIEEGLNQKLSALGSDLHEQIKSLDERVKLQFDEILKLFNKETNNRESQKEDLTKEIGVVNDVIVDLKVAQQDKLDMLSKSFNAVLKSEKESIEQGIQEKVEHLSVEVNEALNRLEEGKLNRVQFADLLAGLAQQIGPGDNSEYS